MVNHPSLCKLNILLEPTDPSNKNSVATVDNAIKQLESEIRKIAPQSTTINETVLALALKNLNAMIRNRGLSAHEILFSRTNETNENLHLSDRALFDKQKDIKTHNNDKSNIPRDNKNQVLKTGDFIAVTNEEKKHNSRDVYVVSKVFDEKLQVNKMIRFSKPTSKIQTKPRIVRKNDVFKVKPTSQYNDSKYVTQEVMSKNSFSTQTKRPANISDVAIQKWSPFGNVYIDYDDFYEIDSENTASVHRVSSEGSSHSQVSENPPAEYATSAPDTNADIVSINNNNIIDANVNNEYPVISDIATNTASETVGDEYLVNDNIQNSQVQVDDPYLDIRKEDERRKKLAENTSKYDICKPDEKITIDEPDFDTFDPIWDHDFDKDSPTYDMYGFNEREFEDDVFIHDALQHRELFGDCEISPIFPNPTDMTLESTLSPMSRVQSVELLYEEHDLNIQTDKCQNLEHVLNPQSKKKRKKISPLRQELPLERYERERVTTRAMHRKQVRLTSSLDNIAKASLSNYYNEGEGGEKEGQRNNP